MHETIHRPNIMIHTNTLADAECHAETGKHKADQLLQIRGGGGGGVGVKVLGG